eukprot:TRINITY_DN7921_c0_g1_i1.p1 TRINITY_DN7921_c0_g1~~TRINITY_DN7921_c0_g1_i1.p1  ORF type:complete len:157 (+),score=28.49 TRINITY_DN7921_c0_g1_i1:37-471(+)
MADSCTKKLHIEKMEWHLDCPSNWALVEDPENKHIWRVSFDGAKDTKWAGKRYTIIFEFPKDYPNEPPKCRFEPPIFHPNVNPYHGFICYSALEEKNWPMAYLPVFKVILALIEFMSKPYPDNPLNEEAADLYINNRQSYEEKS